MDETTISIMERMQTQLRDYSQGNCSLRALVNALEGGFNAVEEEMPFEFNTKWFIHWGGLEQILAVGTEVTRKNEIMEDVKALEILISTIINPES